MSERVVLRSGDVQGKGYPQLLASVLASSPPTPSDRLLETPTMDHITEQLSTSSHIHLNWAQLDSNDR